MSVVLPIRLSTQEKRRAAASTKKRDVPLATYLKQLLQKESSSTRRFEIGGKAPRIPETGLSRDMAYE
jgi:hypothetical protein